MKFQIVTLQPEGYLHSRCFEEIAELLELSLRDLGVEAIRAINRLHPQEMNLLLGYHLIPDPKILGEAPYGVYQLEHLTALPEWLQERALAVLRGARWVWDYSLQNQDWLRRQGIESTLVIPGYHPQLQKIQLAQNPEIDLLFFGAVTPRRAAILEKIAKKIPNLKILEGVYGKERDEWIARSKAILNLHSYDRPLFEAVRISYLLNNRCAVISEPSEGELYGGIPSLRFSEEDCDHLKEFIEEPIRLRAIAESEAETFKNDYSMVTHLKDKISNLF